MGAMVDWLGWEVERLQEIFLYREMRTTVISEIRLAGNSWGRALVSFGSLPSSISAPRMLVGLGLPPVGSSWPQPHLW